VARLTSLGWVIALPICGGILIGRVVDNALDSGPYATLAFLGGGIALSFYEAYRTMAAALRGMRR
jgi:hypothetical protein